MKENPIREDYEYALLALSDVQLQQSEAFKQWMRDEAHRKLFRELSEVREALMQEGEVPCPDTERSWEHLSVRLASTAVRKPSVSLRTFYWLTTAAAVLLAAVWISLSLLPDEGRLPNQIVAVYPALPEPQEVTLSTQNGLTLTVTNASDDEEMAKVGAEVEKQENVLRYHKTAEEEQILMHTLTTPRGKGFKVELEDGTEVWLNAESRLHYPVKFVGKERIVELEGEAFFRVAKDASRPFIVKSGSIETHVLGTQFNFRNYLQEEGHVTLVSGSVKVEDREQNKELLLRPGQDVALGQTELIAREVNVDEFTAWTKGLFYFGNAELSEIMKTLGHWYNLTIVFMDEASMHYHFSFWSQRNDTPEQMIERLNHLGKVTATFDKEHKTITIKH